MKMDTIICPHCKKEVQISSVLKNQLEEKLLSEIDKKHQEELLETREKAKEEASRKLENEFFLKLKKAEDDNRDKEERIKLLLEQVTQITKDLREAKKEKEEEALKMQKALAEEEGKIRLEESRKAEEKEKLKILEKDKQLQDALKEVEEMRRKLQQGSQQAQGEAFELEFEKVLTKQYPNDQILPVGKGVRGGDIIQEVWDARGNLAGKILWELKNTKAWSEGWIDKLKVDKRSSQADEAVIISEILPPQIEIAGFRNGVWVTKRNFVIPLADTLRAKLIQLYYVKNSVQAKDAKMEILYGYLSGTEFKHRVEAIIEAFTAMQNEIEKEKRYFSLKWARDEKNIRQVIDSTYGMHGDLKGIIGTVLPQIKGIDLPELTPGDKE